VWLAVVMLRAAVLGLRWGESTQAGLDVPPHLVCNHRQQLTLRRPSHGCNDPTTLICSPSGEDAIRLGAQAMSRATPAGNRLLFHASGPQ
jgi:hypothetical protein